MNDAGLGRTVLELAVDKTKYSQDLEQAKKQALGFGATLDPGRKGLKAFSDESVKVGKILTASLSLPLALAGGSAIKFAVDFNKAMANVATLIPGNAARVNELKATVQDLAIATGKSTDDLADGLYQVISAFGDTSDTARILEINARAAAAGLATTTDAINLTSAVTKGYGDTSAGAVEKVSDLAFQAVKLGQTTFPELAGAIGRVTPLTAELGVKQEELFGVMATFTGVTGGAAEVSTQLRGVLQALLSPTDAMKELFKHLGVESGKALIAEKGLHGAMLAIVQAAQSGHGDLKDYLGSIEGQTLALSASGAQSETFTQKLGEMGKATGAATEAFKEQSEGVNAAGFQWEQFKQAAIVAAQKLGDELLPIITDVGTQLKPMVEWLLKGLGHFKDLPEPVKKATVGLAALLVIAGPLAIGLGKVAVALDVLAASKGLLLLSTLGTKLVATGAAAGLAGAALGAFVTDQLMKAIMAGRDVASLEADIAQVLSRSGGLFDKHRDIDLPTEELLRFNESVTVTATATKKWSDTNATAAELVKHLREQVAGLSEMWRAYEQLGTAGSAMRTEWLTEQADAILKATRNAAALGVELPAAFQRAGQAASELKTAELFTYLREKTHAIAVQWQQDTERAAKARADAISENEWKSYGVQWEYQEKLHDLTLTGTKRRLAQIKREHEAAVIAAKAQVDTTQEAIDRQVKAYDAYYDLLERMAGGTADTLVERMREQGIQTRAELEQTARQAEADYARMKASGLYTADALVAAAERVKDAQRAARGETVSWGAALQGLADVVVEIGDQVGGTAKGVIGTMSLAVDAIGEMFRGNYAAGAMFVLKAGKFWDEIQRRQNELIAGNRSLVKSFVETEGGVAALSAKLKLTGLEWDQWASYLERVKDNTKLTERAIANLTAALDRLKARQDAAAEGVALVSELVTDWLAPIQKVKGELAEAQQTYDDLVGEGNADPLKLAEAQAKVTLFEAKLAALGEGAQDAFDLLTSSAVDAFGASFRATGDFYGSLVKVGPILEDLIEAQDTFGLAGGGAIADLLEIRRVQQEYHDLLDPLNLATRAAQAAAQAGIRNVETYQLLARDAVKAYRAMIDGGKDAKVAQALLQPTLQTLWQLWKDGKIAIDDETAALLTQAEEHGIVGKDQQSINEKMLEAFDGLTAAIEAMTLAIRAFGNEAGAAFSRARRGAELLGYAVPRGTPPVAGGLAPPGAITTEPRARAVPRWHGGGLIGMQPVGASLWKAGEAWARAHTGLLVGPAARAASEVPILAQVGEGFLSRDVGMPALGRWALAAMNEGQAPGDRSSRDQPLPVAPPVVQIYAITAMDGADVERVLIRHGGRSLTKAVRTNAFHANPELKQALKALLDL